MKVFRKPEEFMLVVNSTLEIFWFGYFQMLKDYHFYIRIIIQEDRGVLSKILGPGQQC